jgi:squalene-associated FAD-dependent desaturase
LAALIIGAGLAGLSAGVRLAAAGVPVRILEASAQAGGRCRSYHDPVLEMTLDNGNHLVLSGNRDVAAYLAMIGAADRLRGPRDASLDFCDVREGRRWTIRPNDGPAPWWLLDPARRVPGTKARDYLALARLMAAPRGAAIGEVLPCRGALWDRLLDPFLLAALNTPAKEGSAALAGAVIAQSLARGGKAYQARIAWPHLASAFVDPALAFLETRGGRLRLGTPVRALDFAGGRLDRLVLGDGAVRVERDDVVILAAPPWIAAALVPDLVAPDRFHAIVNGHFKIAPPPGAPAIVGVIGGVAEWIFAFDDRISVTVSAADALADKDRDALIAALWADIRAVHPGLPDVAPPARIVKERRATFAATPSQNARRPGAVTAWPNLILAGDWTDTGLPATIEGALRSGRTAAAHALKLLGEA